MNQNELLIQKFYEAFSKKDASTMAECYHDEAKFSDEAFINLSSSEVKAMWKMLCERGKDLKLEFSGIEANDYTGKAHWEAWYTFGKTGNKVHNIIDAKFTFKDGKILTHQDSFDFYRWSSQALGMTGKLLGWTGFLRKKVQNTSRQMLENYIKK